MISLVTQPSVTAVSMTGLTSFLDDNKVDVRPILTDARMAAADIGEPDVYYSLPQTAAAFIAALKATKDPYMGLHAAECSTLTVKHPFLLAARHAPDLRTSLRMLAAHLDRATLKRSSFKAMPEYGFFEWEVDYNDIGYCTLTDYLAVRFLKMIQRGPGEAWRPVHVRLARPAPVCSDEHRRIFGPNIEFASSGFNRFIIDRNTLRTPMPDDDSTLFASLTDYCERRLKPGHTLGDPIAGLRLYLQRSLNDNTAGLAAAAAHFGLSEVELRRRLEARGTTFAELFDSTRRELAQGYLNDTQMPLSEVAARLGFAQQSAFTRAARRWFGVSPSVYRRRRLAGKVV